MEEEIRRILAEQVGPGAEHKNAKTPDEIDAAVKRLQAAFAPLRSRYSVDEFIAEKREEARREFADEPRPFEK
ncbi:MAG: hypothetical protein WDM91_09215 [Rhizomicrobium sp.]